MAAFDPAIRPGAAQMASERFHQFTVRVVIEPGIISFGEFPLP